mmetsp:Transcript_75425/g.157265  ORF Transcript_75425/g.157265 Transcript_75425/m.157265 type:complete len:472 (-) Transcript_75425:58-1473(-)
MFPCGSTLHPLSHVCDYGRDRSPATSKDRMATGSSTGSGSERHVPKELDPSLESPVVAGAENEETFVDVEAMREQARRLEEQARRDQQLTEAENARRHAQEKTELEEDRKAWAEELAWLEKIDKPLPWYRRLWRRLWDGNEPEQPRRRFLFACDLGDPISCVHLSSCGVCMAGSVQGRVWIVSGNDGGSVGSLYPSLDGTPPLTPPRSDLLTGWSDEGARALYLDDDCGYVTYLESCRGWRRARPHSQIGHVRYRDLERKNTQVVKHVLQHGPWVCILYPLSTTLVHVAHHELIQRPFKLFDYGSSTDVAPCDFDGERLLLMDRTRLGSAPMVHAIHLESNEHIEIDEMPAISRITVIKLFTDDSLVYSVGNTLRVFNYKTKQIRHTFRGHHNEIVALDCRHSDTIASLSSDAVIKLWSGTAGTCVRTLSLPGANFFMAYPYYVCMQDNRVAFSCDEGVYMVEMEPLSDEV